MTAQLQYNIENNGIGGSVAKKMASVSGDLVEATLTRAAALTANLARGAQARRKDGSEVSPLSKEAFSFDATGAILRAYGELVGNLDTLQYDGCEDAHDFMCEFLGTDNLAKWSDIAVSVPSAFYEAAKARREGKRLN